MLKPLLALFLISAPAHAAQFTCTGGILLYGFTITGTTDDAHVTNATIVVTRAGQVFRKGSGTITNSTFSAGKQLYFDNTDAQYGNRIILNTRFRHDDVYDGTMALYSKEGNVSVAAACRVH